MPENEVFENYYFIINKRLLKLLGLWPYQKRSLKIFLRTAAVVLILTMMIPQMIRLYEEWHKEDRKIDIVVENFSGFLYFSGILLKLNISIYTEKKLQHIYEEVTRDFKTIRNADERAAMVEFWDFSRLLSIGYSSYAFISGLFFVFTPIVMPIILDFFEPLNEPRHKTICYYAEYFIDQDKYLYQLVLHTLFVVSTTLLVAVAVDATFVVVTYHVLGLFNVLRCRLKQLCNSPNNQIHHDGKQLYKYTYKSIQMSDQLCFMIYQSRIMLESRKNYSLAELIRVTYNDVHFAVTTLLVLGYSIGTVELALNLSNPSIILRMGTLWVGGLLYLFFTNWPGQRIIDSNEKFADAVYSCYWYKLPLKMRPLIKFMMIRCTIPCQMTAGPLLQMNFASVGLIVRTSLSYFTAVASLG